MRQRSFLSAGSSRSALRAVSILKHVHHKPASRLAVERLEPRLLLSAVSGFVADIGGDMVASADGWDVAAVITAADSAITATLWGSPWG